MGQHLVGDVLDFHKVLKHPEALAALLAFAESECSEENLLFYSRAERFRVVAKESGVRGQAMTAEARALVEEFLLPQSPYALNLPAEVLKMYTKGVTPNLVFAESTSIPVTADMFDQAIDVIYHTIKDDTFARFKQAPEADSLLRRFPGLGQRFTKDLSTDPNKQFVDPPTSRRDVSNNTPSFMRPNLMRSQSLVGMQGLTIDVSCADSASETEPSASAPKSSGHRLQAVGRKVIEAMGHHEDGTRPRHQALDLMLKAVEAFQQAGE